MQIDFEKKGTFLLTVFSTMTIIFQKHFICYLSLSMLNVYVWALPLAKYYYSIMNRKLGDRY